MALPLPAESGPSRPDLRGGGGGVKRAKQSDGHDTEPRVTFFALREAASTLGRKGGLASAAVLTRDERKARGKKAVSARWAKYRALTQVDPEAEELRTDGVPMVVDELRPFPTDSEFQAMRRAAGRR